MADTFITFIVGIILLLLLAFFYTGQLENSGYAQCKQNYGPGYTYNYRSDLCVSPNGELKGK